MSYVGDYWSFFTLCNASKFILKFIIFASPLVVTLLYGIFYLRDLEIYKNKPMPSIGVPRNFNNFVVYFVNLLHIYFINKIFKRLFYFFKITPYVSKTKL